MNAAVRERLVRDFFTECWNGRDYTAADRLYDDTFTDPGAPGLTGGAAKAHLVGAYHEAFPDLNVRIDDLVATGTDVVVRYTVNLGRLATGVPATAWAVSFLHFQGGRVTTEWMGVDRELGLPGLGRPAGTEDDDFAAALEREHSASERMLRGDSAELKQLCTHAGDLSLAGRGGGYECGWADVSARFDWVAGQYADGHLEHRLLGSAHSGDLGYSFELVSGRVRFRDADAPVPIALRETHVWRREADGWKLLHRHADQLLTKVEQLAGIDQSWLDGEHPTGGMRGGRVP